MSEHEPGSEHGIERGVHSEGEWAERRREYLRTLQEMARFNMHLIDGVDALDPDDPELVAKVEELWQQGVQMFGPDVTQKASRYTQLRSGIEEGNIGEKKGEARLAALVGASGAHTTRQLNFLYEMRRCADMLLKKHDTLMGLPKDTDG